MVLRLSHFKCAAHEGRPHALPGKAALPHPIGCLRAGGEAGFGSLSMAAGGRGCAQLDRARSAGRGSAL